jgi:hypothetical protein
VRRRFLATIALVLGVLTVPQSASAGKPSSTCPPGFDLGGLTIEQSLQLPNIQAGLAAGFLDEASLREAFAGFDANEDEIICFQTIPASGATANPASNWQYLYNVVDNNAAVPSG